MNEENSVSWNYDMFIDHFRDYADIYDSLYKIIECSDEEINGIFQDIKTILIEKYKVSPSELLTDISYMAHYRLKYTKTYWSIFKKIYEEFRPNISENTFFIFKNLASEVYGIEIKKSPLNCTLDIHEEKTIFRAIMDDDKNLFISFTEMEGFDKDQLLINDAYPLAEEGYYLIELCCYYGAVDCFKLLRSKFNSEIT